MCVRVMCSRLVACVIHVSSLAAGTVWDTFADQGYPLWQLQITHEVQRSITLLGLVRAALTSVYIESPCSLFIMHQ